MLKKEYKFLFILLCVVGIFFYQIFLGRIPFPGDLLVSEYTPWRAYSFLGFASGGMPNKAQYFDVIQQIYPWRVLAMDSYKRLSLPLWNPYNFSGTPLLANNQSAVLYPFNIMYALLPAFAAWALLVILQPLLASWGTYLFARKIGIGKWGSLLSAIAYGFCLFQSVFLEYNTIGHVIALLPWTLLGVELVFSNKRIWGSLLLISAIAFSFFAGHIQITGFSLLFVFLYSFFRIQKVKNKLASGFFLCLLGLIALAASAVQLIPTFELIGQAARVQQNYQFLITNLLIQPSQMILFLIPDLFGNPATRNYLLADSYPGNALYIGILPFLFGLLALSNFRRNTHIQFFALACVGLLVFVIRTPFTEIFYRLNIPLFSTGSPSNALFLVSFALSILGGYGLEVFLEKKEKVVLLLFVAFFAVFPITVFLSKISHSPIQMKNVLFSFLLVSISCCLVIAFFFLKKRTALLTFCIILFTVGDLFYFFVKFNPFVSPKLVYPSTPVISILKQSAGINRVWSYGEAAISPNVLSLFHLNDVQGYDPLYPKIYGEFIASSRDGVIHKQFTNASRSDAVIAPAFQEKDLAQNVFRFNVLDSLSVSTILSKETLSNDFLTQHHWKSVASLDGYTIYHNLSAVPRAYIATTSQRYQGSADFGKKFFSPAFDLHRSVLLEDLVSLSATEGYAHISSYTPENVSIQTQTNGKGILVLTDTYFPGWKVFIDGHETRILKANFTLRGVVVPKGVHTVIFSYQPASFSIGLTLTIMGILGLGTLIFLLKKGVLVYE